jgi:hypothetical protein
MNTDNSKLKIAFLKHSKDTGINPETLQNLCKEFKRGCELIPITERVPCVEMADGSFEDILISGFVTVDIYTSGMLYDSIDDFIADIIWGNIEENEDGFYQYSDDIEIYLK